MIRPRKRLRYAKTVAVGCDPLPRKCHGKEGVSGSSPEEGFAVQPASSAFLLSALTSVHGSNSGLKSMSPTTDTVKWDDIRAKERHVTPAAPDALVRLRPGRAFDGR
jgi:hypothetical protein